MAQGEVFYFKNRPATESADKNRNDKTQEREHAGDTTAAHPKTLDFSTRLGFSVATAPRALRKLHVAAPRRPNSACDLRFAAALIGGVRCASKPRQPFGPLSLVYSRPSCFREAGRRPE